MNTVDSDACFALAGRKGFVNFESYSFVAENGSYVWYIYSDNLCSPAKALYKGAPCALDACCGNGGFFYQNNNTDLFNAIRIGLPPKHDGDNGDGLAPYEIILIVAGSIMLAVAIAAVVFFIIKRRKASYQSV
jgi:hypothetical protein